LADFPRLAVFASGRGSNLRALVDASCAGRLRATVALVVSNRSTSGALAFARERGIAARHMSTRTHDDLPRALRDALVAARINAVALAGYLRPVPSLVLRAFPERVFNIHPAPLPRFGGPGMYGIHVHRAVLEAGVAWSGPTVHLVTERYDEGPVLAHVPVPVEPGDTPEVLAARVLAVEHRVYPAVLDAQIGATARPVERPAAPDPDATLRR